MTNQTRLARLLGDLADAGVTVTVRGGQIHIQGMDRERWLDDWLERNQTALLLLLGAPDGHQATRTPLPLPEDGRDSHSCRAAIG